jgi:hypothetical protein
MPKDIPLEQEEAQTCKEVCLEQEGLLGKEAYLERGWGKK